MKYMKRIDKFVYPLDKINSKIWNLSPEQFKGTMTFNLAKKGSKEPLNAIFEIDFNGLEGKEFSKKIDNYDKRVYYAVAALYSAGNNTFSLTQIHYAMGGTSRPKSDQLKRIYESIEKMSLTKIYLDNTAEVEKYKKRALFRYDDYLLPMNFVSTIINGKLTDSAVHISEMPPLMQWAKDREQITSFPVQLLQSSMSKTNANLLLEDYLIRRISRAKHDGQNFRILNNSLFEAVNAVSQKQKQRTMEKLRALLSYYADKEKCGFIESYVIQNDGLLIRL